MTGLEGNSEFCFPREHFTFNVPRVQSLPRDGSEDPGNEVGQLHAKFTCYLSFYFQNQLSFHLTADSVLNSY